MAMSSCSPSKFPLGGEGRSSSRSKPLNKGGALQAVTEEVVGIHVLLTHSLFACDILRRLLPRNSLAKPTSAPVRFLSLRKMKPQFGPRQHPSPRETHHGAGVFRHCVIALLNSFSHRFGLADGLKSFRGTIR